MVHMCATAEIGRCILYLVASDPVLVVQKDRWRERENLGIFPSCKFLSFVPFKMLVIRMHCPSLRCKIGPSTIVL